jgi:hypothetical protein
LRPRCRWPHRLQSAIRREYFRGSFHSGPRHAFAVPVKGVGLLGKSLIGRKKRGCGDIPRTVGLREANTGGVGNEPCPRQVANCISGMTGLTAGKILPRASAAPVIGAIDAAASQQIVIPSDGGHAAVAIDAVHSAGLHGSALALGDLAGMALVA